MSTTDDKPFLIVSDIHLGAVPQRTEKAFRDFLRHAGDHAAGLLINGDLFDFWFEYRTVVPSKHFRVLGALADLVDAGVPVWFMGGNHDAWAGAFLRDEVGLRLLNGPALMDWANRRVLIVHGDGVGRGDHAYRAFRWLIRHPVTVAGFRVLHPDFGAWIANHASSTEDKAEHGGTEGRSRAGYIEEWAIDQLSADPSIDLVIAGHSHSPQLVEVEAGRHYVNSGDWIHHYSYVELPASGGQPRLKRWPV
jgi:UDP-2,3-diacylglucosamine hydrolase